VDCGWYPSLLHLRRTVFAVEATNVEIRVLGCLIEKQRTTPDAYPLSLNALRLACNQATNRDPVVDFEEPEIRAALERLSQRDWVRLASGPGSRAVKYRHLLDQALGLSDGELAVLAVLMLRGAQTPGELRQRTERLHSFATHEELAGTLEGLASRELVVRVDRRAGQKEDRYRQLLGGDGEEPPAATPHQEDDRFAALEERLGRLEETVEEILQRLSR
jgi:uncharacterized protein YceH (UPF0502 family)